MNERIAPFLAELAAVPKPEAVAVAAAIAYLVLAIRQSIWCWPCACLSTALYVILFVDARLYMESVLNLFYFAMAVYGWALWTRGGRDAGPLPVTTWPAGRHVAAILVVAAAAAVNGWLLTRFTDAAFPYADSLTTWGAVWATYLVARKVFENWWYWLLIDGVSVVIYWMRGLELTSALYLLYLLLIPFGLLSWRRSMRTASP